MARDSNRPRLAGIPIVDIESCDWRPGITLLTPKTYRYILSDSPEGKVILRGLD